MFVASSSTMTGSPLKVPRRRSQGDIFVICRISLMLLHSYAEHEERSDSPLQHYLVHGKSLLNGLAKEDSLVV